VIKLRDGEDWFLQISIPTTVSRRTGTRSYEAAATGAAKPLLTAGAGPYELAAPRPGHRTCITFDHFHDDRILYQGAAYLDDTQMVRPGRGRAFSPPISCLRPEASSSTCPYDPGLYFHGEELSLAVRDFTHGYDLFHPTRDILWHSYSRALIRARRT